MIYICKMFLTGLVLVAHAVLSVVEVLSGIVFSLSSRAVWRLECYSRDLDELEN